MQFILNARNRFFRKSSTTEIRRVYNNTYRTTPEAIW